MKTNTIVTASDKNYLWGVFMLIASMRKNNMDEPVLVFGKDYDDEAKKILSQFDDVKIVDAPFSTRSMTCRKPEAMLLAQTEFVTWADCDGFFVDNCSEVLTPKSADEIMIRRRSEAEALIAGLSVHDKNGNLMIAPFMTDTWQKDVGQRKTARLKTCCSACIMSLSMAQKKFLEHWRDHMEKFFPQGDVGVVDNRNPAYFQTDESALNAMLCFLDEAPTPTQEFPLNHKGTVFIHFISQPKPWIAWSRYSLRRASDYLDVVDYAISRGLKLPSKLPFALNRKYIKLFPILAPFVDFRQKTKTAIKKFRAKL